jgi:5-methylcytosine-specific restriction endonuclease McrA
LNDPLVFLGRLLELLETTRYTATYKFAVLVALIDECVEASDELGAPPTKVSARAVGRRVFEMFWTQAVPYRVDAAGREIELRHSTQAGDLLQRIADVRRRLGIGPGATIDAARRLHAREIDQLERHVVATVIRMPIPKLQRVTTGAGAEEDRFIYDIDWPDEVAVSVINRAGFDDTMRLRPGVGELLQRLAPLLRPAIQQRWADFVARRSGDVVEDSQLHQFLFGIDRTSLQRVCGPLRELQSGACFYCRDHLRGRADVDHFVPWSRHADNGIHNLVVAHPRCNNAKRDSLAASSHLRRWLDRVSPGAQAAAELAELAGSLRWPAHAERTAGVARSVYLWLPRDTLLWSSVGTYERSDPERLRSLLVGPGPTSCD